MNDRPACPECGSENTDMPRQYGPGMRLLYCVAICKDCGHEGTRHATVEDAHKERMSWAALTASIPSTAPEAEPWVAYDAASDDVPTGIRKCKVEYADGTKAENWANQFAWRNTDNPSAYRIVAYKVVERDPAQGEVVQADQPSSEAMALARMVHSLTAEVGLVYAGRVIDEFLKVVADLAADDWARTGDDIISINDRLKRHILAARTALSTPETVSLKGDRV